MAGNVAYLRSEQRIDSKWHARWRWRAFQESTKVIGTLGMIPNEEKLNFFYFGGHPSCHLARDFELDQVFDPRRFRN